MHDINLSNLDWEDAKCFRAAASAGTLRAAAERLGVHHSTISRRIDNLEQTLRTRLIERTPDGYVLTPAGEDILAATNRFAEHLQDADRRIAGRDDLLQGDIRVTIAGPLAVAAFAPRLAEFTNAYPGLSVHLDTRVDFADLARREADIAIRMDNSPTETLVGKRLFPYFETVYASPGYLAAHKIDQYPKSARWLGWKDPPEPHPDWTAKTEFSAVPVWGCFPDPHLQQAAARNGLGLAMLPCILGDMDPGLVRATKRPPTPARDIWILTHPDLRRVARVKAFTTFAETVLRSLEAELKGERPQSA